MHRRAHRGLVIVVVGLTAVWGPAGCTSPRGGGGQQSRADRQASAPAGPATAAGEETSLADRGQTVQSEPPEASDASQTVSPPDSATGSAGRESGGQAIDASSAAPAGLEGQTTDAAARSVAPEGSQNEPAAAPVDARPDSRQPAQPPPAIGEPASAGNAPASDSPPADSAEAAARQQQPGSAERIAPPGQGEPAVEPARTTDPVPPAGAGDSRRPTPPVEAGAPTSQGEQASQVELPRENERWSQGAHPDQGERPSDSGPPPAQAQAKPPSGDSSGREDAPSPARAPDLGGAELQPDPAGEPATATHDRGTEADPGPDRRPAGGASPAPFAGPSGQPLRPGMRRGYLTLDHNPTTASDRGSPTLDDVQRPCAWLTLDDQPGTMRPGLLQWFIEEPVSKSPTVTIWIVEELLGDLVDVQLMLRKFKDVEPDVPHASPPADPLWDFRLSAAAPGIIKPGIAYPLCTSRDFFLMKNMAVNEHVDSLPLLIPGQYAIIGYVTGTKAPDKTLVVTYFTVGNSASTRED